MTMPPTDPLRPANAAFRRTAGAGEFAGAGLHARKPG